MIHIYEYESYFSSNCLKPKAVCTGNPSLKDIKAKLFKGFEYWNKQAWAAPVREYIDQETFL